MAGSAALRRRSPERQRQGEEPLLDAVVQVALDPSSLRVAALDDAGTGRTDLLQLAAELPVETAVVHDQSHHGDAGREQRRVLRERPVVHEQCERAVRARRRASRSLMRRLPGPAADRHGRPRMQTGPRSRRSTRSDGSRSAWPSAASSWDGDVDEPTVAIASATAAREPRWRRIPTSIAIGTSARRAFATQKAGTATASGIGAIRPRAANGYQAAYSGAKPTTAPASRTGPRRYRAGALAASHRWTISAPATARAMIRARSANATRVGARSGGWMPKKTSRVRDHAHDRLECERDDQCHGHGPVAPTSRPAVAEREGDEREDRVRPADQRERRDVELQEIVGPALAREPLAGRGGDPQEPGEHEPAPGGLLRPRDRGDETAPDEQLADGEVDERDPDRLEPDLPDMLRHQAEDDGEDRDDDGGAPAHPRATRSSRAGMTPGTSAAFSTNASAPEPATRPP